MNRETEFSAYESFTKTNNKAIENIFFLTFVEGIGKDTEHVS